MRKCFVARPSFFSPTVPSPLQTRPSACSKIPKPVNLSLSMASNTHPLHPPASSVGSADKPASPYPVAAARAAIRCISAPNIRRVKPLSAIAATVAQKRSHLLGSENLGAIYAPLVHWSGLSAGRQGRCRIPPVKRRSRKLELGETAQLPARPTKAVPASSPRTTSRE